MSFVIHNSGCKIVKIIYFQELQRLQTSHVVVCLRPAWIVLLGCKITEAIFEINSITKEDVIVNIHLSICRFIWVEWSQIALGYSNSSFSSCFKEIVVNLLYCSVSLCSLCNIFLWEVLDNLIFFVPVSDSLWVKAV